MTWMQHGSSAVSLLMFAALHTSDAPFGYLQWAETAGAGRRRLHDVQVSG
ncbi:MAG TPA: hypothetical protein VGG35_13615 [Streptosporangiaceae bacterium]